MPSLRGREIQKIIENSVRIREDVIRALFFLWICAVCAWRRRAWAQPSPQACAVPMKWNKEGTATVASLCCAHEMEQGGHSHRGKLTLCPRNGTRRAQTPPGAYAVPMKNECLHLDRNMM